MAYGKPSADIVEETERILKASREKKILLKLLGGLAIRLHCPSATYRSLRRKYPDIDWVGLRKQDRQIEKLFPELNYTPNKLFNAIHGHERLQFGDLENERVVDIILDKFKMCHALDLRDRLEIDERTIPLADLLLTKLQVVELNEKDIRDSITLFKDHTLEETDSPETISITRISKICSKDWGWYKTMMINLEKLLGLLPNYKLSKNDEDETREKINIVLKRIEREPKSMMWKMRGLIGERKRWWFPVEEVLR